MVNYFSIRYLAAGALSRVGPDAGAAVPALARALTDPEFEVRAFALIHTGAECGGVLERLSVCVTAGFSFRSGTGN